MDMIRLQPVRKEDHDLLWNVNQKYLYEMNEKNLGSKETLDRRDQTIRPSNPSS